MEPLRGSRTGQRVKNAQLNEQQATLFITYLQNTPPVRRFKKRLVHDFFAMREELTKRRTLREVGKPVQRELTDAIRDSGEAERMHGHASVSYTHLIPIIFFFYQCELRFNLFLLIGRPIRSIQCLCISVFPIYHQKFSGSFPLQPNITVTVIVAHQRYICNCV